MPNKPSSGSPRGKAHTGHPHWLSTLNQRETWIRAFTYSLFVASALSVAATDAAILLLFIAVIYHRFKSTERDPLPWWLIAAFLALPVSAVLAAVANPEHLNNAHRLRDFYRIFVPLALASALVQLERRRLLLSLLAPVVLMGIYAVIQYFWGVDWVRPEGSKLITPATEPGSSVFHGKGTFSHHLTFAGYMLVIVPLFAALALESRGRERWIWALGSLAAAIGVLVSLGRSGWLGAAVGMGLLLIGFPRRIAAPLVAMLLFLAITGGVIASGWLQHVLPYEEQPTIVKRLLITSLYRDRGRLYSWEAALMGIRKYPIFGVGYGNDRYYFPEYRLAMQKKYDYQFRISLTTHAHNVYLQVLFELGLVGLAAYFYLWGAVYWWSANWVRRAGSRFPFESALISGATSGLAGSMVAGLFENNFFDSEVQTILLLAMGLCLHAGLVIRRGLAGGTA